MLTGSPPKTCGDDRAGRSSFPSGMTELGQFVSVVVHIPGVSASSSKELLLAYRSISVCLGSMRDLLK
jgi:hypothetical protein